jgi:hypothetical protein
VIQMHFGAWCNLPAGSVTEPPLKHPFRPKCAPRGIGVRIDGLAQVRAPDSCYSDIQYRQRAEDDRIPYQRYDYTAIIPALRGKAI